MSIKAIAILSSIAIVFVFILAYVFNINNTATGLGNLIIAQGTKNTAEYDNMWKTIKQTAQVTEAQKNAIMEVVVGYATARGGNKGSLATLVHEAVPNVDVSTFTKLQNIIDSKRSEWTRNQVILVDYKREHDNLMDMQPSGFVLKLLGHKKMDITIVTSGKTKESFRTGEDNDTELFEKKK
jgi:hypothetical protein